MTTSEYAIPDNSGTLSSTIVATRGHYSDESLICRFTTHQLSVEKAIHGPCPRMRAIKSPLGQHPKTPRVFGIADRRIRAAADYFHSLLWVLPSPSLGDTLALRYRETLASPNLSLTLSGSRWQLFTTGFFDHLWFLWYLCWLVATVALAEAVRLKVQGRHRWWLVPSSCLPSALMWSPYGPDTSLGRAGR